MSGRPEILFPLFSDLTSLSGIGDKIATTFGALKITKPRDLIFTLPHSVVDRRVVPTVQGLPAPKIVRCK